MPRPNVLMLMTDQHHAACVGYRGHPDVKTPNLDRLAAGGTHFTNAFVQNGVCVPSRISYLTGQYVHTHGVFDGTTRRSVDHLLSLPAWLGQHGYRTAICGKKHLLDWKTHGFEYERVNCDPHRNDYGAYLRKHGVPLPSGRGYDSEKFCFSDDPMPAEHTQDTWAANEAIRYIEATAEDGRPFFLQYSSSPPHPPVWLPPGCPITYAPDSLRLPENSEEVTSAIDFDRNVELKWTVSHHGEAVFRQAMANYYALISLADHNIGRVLDCLMRQGLTENTLVIFCADHGDFAGEYSRMAKGFHFDATHRVPFLWHWPGHLGSGQAKDGLVQAIDMFPTICELLELPIPPTVQGQSLAGVLTSDADSDQQAVFWEFLGCKTIRTRTHKLNYALTDAGPVGELFDLTVDPHTYHSRFDDPACAEAQHELTRRLLDWWIATQQPAAMGIGYEDLPASRYFQHDPEPSPPGGPA